MHERSFYDPEGHHWAVFWMQPGASTILEPTTF